ncbi:MAG: flavin reductase family protein [Mesorhizobium sp.]|uniref:flavin reductase family protein n=1 Tax=unclassified Mesorhizobium TaxID=325217 RepID=UPI000FCB40F5|nr:MULTISPECIES: flavin reductase family protein [unclassified Mesorhizobium]RUU26101.1 flavin reductase family protein [Mesorhizobium sp. M6A.T.Ce.TU.016.01.1.1]RUU98409.1 flavin reductase family protein [Mesorhizobium sp. M6A.T.Cr.TU.017.01.1.1]RVB73083.1 flavin reductase family protein [Mesorhizobium sp. M6A.T.Cr.TU.014.01.1.1]RWN25595.1 MAG: flavin reductase family protein [Mesorhizobium sp.]RWN66382.1 MAG: flavin reductase family protein [Mesorhizobium sp.]
MFYEPSKGHGLPHDPSKAIVAPRPIGWISTVNKAGKLNLAPYSFFNAFSTRPFIVWFSSEGEKDSATFAEETGEFVANLVSRDLAEKMVRTAVDAPRGVSEFDYADLAMAPSRLVAPPRVAAAPAALECRVTEILRPKALDGTATSAVIVAGEVVGVHIDDAFLNDGIFDIVKAGNVGRLGYMDYASVSEIFPMRRPRWGKD